VTRLAIVVALIVPFGGPATHHSPRPKPVPKVCKKKPAKAKHHRRVCKKKKAKPKPKPPVGATPTPTPTPTPAPTPLPSRTGVDLNEYTVRAAHRTLAAGPIDFNATNFGMDDHNLTIDSPSGVVLGAVDTPADGGTGTLHVTLSPGRYKLYCSLFDHELAGMKTTVTVK
jgi:hypothetical protein